MRVFLRTYRAPVRPAVALAASRRCFMTETKTQAPAGLTTSLRTPEIVSLADKILALNVMEVMELQKVLAERTGVDVNAAQVQTRAAAPVAEPAAAAAGAAAPGAAAGASAAPAAAAAPKKDTFKMKLVALEEGKKFPVLKILRKVTPNMNLMDSKKLVEELPSVISESMPAADAHKWVAELKEAGATVELS